MKLNIDTKEAGVQASRMEVPDWTGKAEEMLPASSGTLLSQASTLSEETLRVRGVKTNQDAEVYSPSDLMGSGIYDEPITTDHQELMSWAQSDVPVESEPDCTDWMVPAQAQVVALESRSNEYDRSGGSMTVNAGNPYQPGLNTAQMAFESENASTVEESGQANVVYEDGTRKSVSVPGGKKLITPNSLGWAAGSNFQGDAWIGALMGVEQLANNPSDPIAFPNVAGYTAPLFVGHLPSRPSVLNRASVSILSNKAQTITFNLRSNRDYTKVVRSFSQDIPKGESTTTFRMLALGIEPMAMEIDPEDGTQAVLKEYSVFP